MNIRRHSARIASMTEQNEEWFDCLECLECLDCTDCFDSAYCPDSPGIPVSSPFTRFMDKLNATPNCTTQKEFDIVHTAIFALVTDTINVNGLLKRSDPDDLVKFFLDSANVHMYTINEWRHVFAMSIILSKIGLTHPRVKELLKYVPAHTLSRMGINTYCSKNGKKCFRIRVGCITEQPGY